MVFQCYYIFITLLCLEVFQLKINTVKVKEAMDRIGLKTQTDLAKSMHITKGQLSILLSNSYNPIKKSVIHLCDTLNISPEDLLSSSDNIQSSCEFIDETTDQITAIELFAGAGGLALGLEQAGIHTLAYVEIDKFSCETLRQNRPDWNVICDDIHNVDFTPYRDKVDIVTGGFPCQAFSYAGKKMGFEDTRGTLFHEFARCVSEVNPKMFLAENVRGLISHDRGRTLETILNVFSELGYDVVYKVLNAAFYGVGQKRERIVIIGIKKGSGLSFEYPEPDEKMTTLRDALRDCPASEGQSYSENKRRVLDLVPPGGCWVNLPEEIQRSYMGASFNSGGGRRGMARRISWDEPCLTLTCSPSQKQTERCHPDETRPFTVREYARIQSFPDDWAFSGGIGEKYKQIGNAVPVEMARRIGLQLVKSLKNL